MCLILFAWQSHPRYELVLAANRDEFHQRPAAAARFWEDHPDILAGRDLQAGGTWLGVTRSGRLAAVTNYREPVSPRPQPERSRGHLVRDYLEDVQGPLAWAQRLQPLAAAYSGFNLLAGATGELVYLSNRGGTPSPVRPGIHGLSNHLMDTDWPKVQAGRERLAELLDRREPDPGELFGLLTDRALTPGDMPESLEEHLAPERVMKHYFIVSPVYGTRCSTVLLIGRDGAITFIERQFDPNGNETATVSFQL